MPDPGHGAPSGDGGDGRLRERVAMPSHRRASLVSWGRGRPRERVLVVPHAGQRLPGVPAPLLHENSFARSATPPGYQGGAAMRWHCHALSEASLIDDTVRQMREEWRGSRAHVYRESPKRTGLFEHEYAVPVKDSEWQALRDHVIRCLRNFHRLPLLAEIKRTSTDRWILIEDIGSFGWEGTRVFTAPDFGYWSQADRLQLVDWKTGGNGEDASLQLGGYALYALEVLGVDLPRVDLLEVNLREGRVTSHPWDAIGLERVREHVRLSVRAMKAYLKDPEKNLAEEANFEKTEDLRICRWCNFRGVCRPELPPFSEHALPSADRAG
ncbi:MAG: hypothetical protein DMD83_20885 [Candidatus Rokuibacteriota bacterium]|nr:MAG: hypothetical protein DMD83_20885 [Candidatus Rokubacteria bacterium]